MSVPAAAVPDAGVSTPGAADSTAPRFGLATATFVVVSSMVGTGVLTTSGYSILFLGSNQWMLALWVVGGVLAICGALTLCELTALMPRTGGDYVFLHESYGPAVAFLSGWVSFFIGFGGPIALSSSAAATYLLVPWRLDSEVVRWAQPSLAAAIVLVLAAVHCRGRESSIRAQGGMTVVKLVILGTLAVAGVALGWGRWGSIADRSPLTRNLVGSLAGSLVYVTYAYTGWNAASYLAGEVAEPRRTMPRAILLGAGGVTLLYLTLNLAYALALPVGVVRSLVADAGGNIDVLKLDMVKPVAELAARELVGPRVAGPLSVAIGLTLMASVSAYILTGPRVLMAMAQAGQFPGWAGRVSSTGAPVVATLVQVAWALVLLLTAAFEPILTYAAVGLSLFAMLTVSSVFVLRLKRPEAPRPFRVPGYPVTPLVFLVGTGLLIGSVATERPALVGLSVASILLGIPVFHTWRWVQRDRGPATS